jgi:Fe-S oxidoreductase
MHSEGLNNLGYIPVWTILGLLGTLAGFAFWLKTAEYVWALQSARGEKRSDHLARRLRLLLVNALGQKRRLDEPVTGIASLLILWAALAHVLSLLWNLVPVVCSRIFSSVLGDWAPLPWTEEIVAVRWVLGAAAALGLLGVAVTVARRLAPRSRRAAQSRSHRMLLAVIATVFSASLAGAVLRSYSGTAADVCWWIQMVATAGLIAWLPFSPERHIVFSPVSMFAAAFDMAKLPPPSVGAGYRDDFTWRELVGGLACADCRRCERVCPVFAATHSGSPRDLMQAISVAMTDNENGRSIPARHLKLEHQWACSTCGVCMQVCPSFNEHVPLVVEFRRQFVAERNVPERLRTAMYDLMRFGNSFAAPPEQRGRWTDGLSFHISDAREKPVSCLWFVGDYASWDPGAAATRAAARVLRRAGVDFGILYEAEENSGNDIRRAGAEAVFQSLAERNRHAIANADFDKIVTTDPHSYNALRNDYEWNGQRPAILHFSQLIEQLLRAGALPLRRELRGTVTYQDPCYLGRYNNVYDAPRRIIGELGLDLVEMPRNRDHAACCGAGGGRLWSSRFSPNTTSPAEIRVREAAAVPGVRTIVTACPKDLNMLRYALRSTGLDDRLEVKDLAELLDEATASSTPSPRQSQQERAAI